MRNWITGAFIFFATATFAQDTNLAQQDTLSPKEFLPDVTVVGKDTRHDMVQMPEIVGTHIFAGKKNALVVVNNVNGNVVNNTMRQILAKVPGIHIWESDGSGVQIGIATRGLSPNRSWDFNIRQNGYDISADPFGYPEAYYNPPMQAVQRIQIIKGAGALQFGPQLGGMVNYVLQDGSDIKKPLMAETQNTVGSFGMLNSYNAIGGTGKQSHYYAFFDHRNGDGWRNNSQYKTNTGFGTYTYRFSDKWKAGIELLHYEMLGQQPGGLTDALFKTDAQQSFRSRNWLNINWTTAAANIDFSPNTNSHFNLKVYGLKGDRNSIGYVQPITVKDSINPVTNQYANRTIDIDTYRNMGAELRHLLNYKMGKQINSLTASARYYKGNTTRYRAGLGDTGSDFNKENLNSPFPTHLNFDAENIALAVENIFRVNKNLIIIPGARWESLSGTVEGRLNYNSAGEENKLSPTRKTRNFLLMGLAAEYHIGNTELYANTTQSYRPIQFADLAVNPTTEIVDPNLKDGKGLSADLGYRGKLGNFLFFDANFFYLKYDNRIGTITQQRLDSTTYNYRTNIGKSSSRGIEALVELNPFQAGWLGKKYGEISVFVSYAYTNARYDDVKVITRASNNTLVETNLKNKRVENAPQHLLRSGFTYFYKTFSLTTQLSYVSSTFSDANNTLTPNAVATVGLIPAYTVADISCAYKFRENYTIKAGINNFTNKRYFTRRAGGYPGPGLMPSDARNYFVTLGIKI
jgi:Fe(3+) dicitrate transport protein